MPLPELSFQNYISHFGEFTLQPRLAREEDRLIAVILSACIGVLSLGTVHATVVTVNAVRLLAKLFYKSPEEHSDQDKKVDQVASESFSSPSTSRQSNLSSPNESSHFSKKSHHRTQTVYSDYFSHYADVPDEEGVKILQKVSTVRLVKKDRFVRKPLDNVQSVQVTPSSSSSDQSSSLQRTQSQIVKEIKKNKNLSISIYADVKRLLDKDDSSLSESILNKVSLLISLHKKKWKKAKRDTVISYPVTEDLFMEVYYHVETKKIVVVTEKFAEGMYNEIIRGYDWDTGEEIVCSRRIPTENTLESLREASQKRFGINKRLNDLKIPGIIQVKFLLLAQKHAIIVSEKMRGYELQDYLEIGYSENSLKGKGPKNELSSLQKNQLVLSFITTMAALHKYRFAHGDVSPQNLFVLVTEQGNVETKLFDFDKTEEFDTKSENDFIDAQISDIGYMGKLLYGLIFSDELHGEEIAPAAMKKRLRELHGEEFENGKMKNTLEGICWELLHVKKEKVTDKSKVIFKPTVSLEQMKERLKALKS